MPLCVSWDAITSVGPTARHTGLYLRAGRSNFLSSPFVDEMGESVVLAPVSLLPKQLTGPLRVAALARHALDGAIRPLAGSLGASRVHLCIALPARYRANERGALSREGNSVLEQLATHERLGVMAGDVWAYPEGVAAGALALAQAKSLLETHPNDLAVVCGADSYYDAAVLAQLEREDRLMTADNLDALRPGEGAACLVLVGARHALARTHAVAQVVAVGVGDEPSARDPEQHTMARGLSAALKTAAMPLRGAGKRCNWLLTDVTHEQRRIRELQLLLARFGDVVGFDLRLETPARELGEVGAATLPLYAVLAMEGWQREYAIDADALCFASSQHGLCGALHLQSAKPRERRS